MILQCVCVTSAENEQVEDLHFAVLRIKTHLQSELERGDGGR